jgi:hypothetical protein
MAISMDMKDSLYSFIGGFTISVMGNIDWILQIDPANSLSNLMIEWTAKIFGTMILGIIGGLAGLFGKDLYKILKNKYDRDNEKAK